MEYISWFDEFDDAIGARVGGKGASLGQMTRAGLPVPPGFSVTTDAYQRLKDDSVARGEVAAILARIDFEDPAGVAEISRKARARIEAIPMDPTVAEHIAHAYERLCARFEREVPVAVRSSATAEDLPDASFAGQQDTFLWVVGREEVLQAVRRCWSSVFTDRAITYRHATGHDHETISMAVCIQVMVTPRTAGVAFTLNPIDGDRSVIAIDASWGFGEAVVSGEVTPDNFLVDRVLGEITSRTISPKTAEYRVRLDGRGVELVPVPESRRTAPSLGDGEVKVIAQLAQHVEAHYGCPQDLEWALDDSLPPDENIVLLQSRAETVWSQKTHVPISRPARDPLEGIVNTLLTPLHQRDPFGGAGHDPGRQRHQERKDRHG